MFWPKFHFVAVVVCSSSLVVRLANASKHSGKTTQSQFPDSFFFFSLSLYLYSFCFLGWLKTEVHSITFELADSRLQSFFIAKLNSIVFCVTR